MPFDFSNDPDTLIIADALALLRGGWCRGLYHYVDATDGEKTARYCTMGALGQAAVGDPYFFSEDAFDDKYGTLIDRLYRALPASFKAPYRENELGVPMSKVCRIETFNDLLKVPDPVFEFLERALRNEEG